MRAYLEGTTRLFQVLLVSRTNFQAELAILSLSYKMNEDAWTNTYKQERKNSGCYTN